MPEEQNTQATETETEAPAAGGDGGESSGSSITDLNTALKELEKARREAARYRTQKNDVKKETEEAARKWQEYLDSQKTELEKASERAAQLEAKVKSFETEKLQRDVAQAVGLDPDLAEFVKGETESEMRASAEKLAEKYPANSGPTVQTGLLAGNRGEPVVSKKKSGGAFLEGLAEAGKITTSS